MFNRISIICFLLLGFLSLFSQGTIHIVTNTLDEGEGSFREAVDNSGAVGEDTIIFNIPESDPGFDPSTGVWTIVANTGFQVAEQTVIYGGMAKGSQNSPRPAIEISGSDSAITLGLIGLRLRSADVLRELVINGFQYGIWIQSNDIIVEQCFIGTDPAGTLGRPNGINGILLANGAINCRIQNNLISGNGAAGIRLFGTETSNNMIIGNKIGTTFEGTEQLPNQGSGIKIESGANETTIVENLISGNGQYGLWLTDEGTSDNIIQDNRIGTDIAGVIGIPNGAFGAVFFNGPSNNTFGPGNQVAYNGNDGVLVDGSDQVLTVRNRITLNSIHDNLGMGINNLRGGNNELSPPSIDSIRADTVFGTTTSGILIELFFDEGDEGCCLVAVGTADTTGAFSIVLPEIPAGHLFLTGTVSDMVGNTSEFSTPFCITFNPVIFEGEIGFCEGESVHLAAGSFTGYLWSNGATTEVITVHEPGTYRISVTDDQGCVGVDTVNVVEYPQPALVLDTMATGCANTQLDAGDFDSYLWSTGDSTALITTALAGIYTVMVTDSNGCTATDSVMVNNDPLRLPWVQELINNPFNPYCNECLTLSQAMWMDSSVIIYDWDAGSCNFTDMGFTTIYNCRGDTIQHCYTSIVGLDCEPDAMITGDDLQDKLLLWQCPGLILPDCPTDSASILALPWLVDTLRYYEDLCELVCTGGNAGNYLYKHTLDTNLILELRTTCSDNIRRFYDCQGTLIYSCTSFSESTPGNCDLPFLPSPDAGELIWQCPSTTGTIQLSKNNLAKLYPTVFSDELTIETEMTIPWKVTFYDPFGHVINSKICFSPMEIIDTQSWPQGIIYARVISQNTGQVVKLFKMP